MSSLERWDKIQTNLNRGILKASVILICLLYKVNEDLETEERKELIRLKVKFRDQLQDLLDYLDTCPEVFQEIRNKIITKNGNPK